ncbi:sigma-70 family RNA polymerase sigma factor [Neorhizobium sp. T6_25]|uniref:sigma-70 family RNA polymerase sigma factor n=1 Tax=Neorhizobium sp. T6_25 TaxID=2093833 RepID=UPI000CF9DF91|nr:sigma-70 family RNA polymerase sigma factor [Neorhizobium sp. T6_25]
MRKLPPDEKVFELRIGGMTVKEIAERYEVGTDMVYNAIRRHKGKPTHADQLKATNDDGRFTRANSQAVEHRDTGDNVGFLQPVSVYKVQRTSLRECGDLLKEWGIGRGLA